MEMELADGFVPMASEGRLETQMRYEVNLGMKGKVDWNCQGNLDIS